MIAMAHLTIRMEVARYTPPHQCIAPHQLILQILLIRLLRQVVAVLNKDNHENVVHVMVRDV